MKGKLVFVAGAAVGYVLGTRAGRARYEQIKTRAQKLWSSEPVQKSVSQVQDFVDDHAQDVPAVVANGAKKVVASVAKRGSGKSGSKRSGMDSASSTSAASSSPGE
ncbi:MAG: YtxH protein [Naasia sp.]|nr:YtxH protein [Naasia sp.]